LSYILVFVALLTGTLAYTDGVLENVLFTRQTVATHHPIPLTVEYTRCLVAVPYSYRDFIGERVYIQTEDGTFGPYLVVDAQSFYHHITADMESNGLVADISCSQFHGQRATILFPQLQIDIHRGPR